MRFSLDRLLMCLRLAKSNCRWMTSNRITGMKIYKYFLILFLLSACTSKQKDQVEELETSQPEQESPTLDSQVAVDFINAYVNFCNSMSDEITITEWAESSQLATSQFKNELKNLLEKAWEEDPEYGLGFDPIIDAQDYPDEGFKILAFDEETGYVLVVGKNWEDFTLNIRVTNQNGKTLVDGCGVINMPEEMRVER